LSALVLKDSLAGARRHQLGSALSLGERVGCGRVFNVVISFLRAILSGTWRKRDSDLSTLLDWEADYIVGKVDVVVVSVRSILGVNLSCLTTRLLLKTS
jgi:hypothetical protein